MPPLTTAWALSGGRTRVEKGVLRRVPTAVVSPPRAVEETDNLEPPNRKYHSLGGSATLSRIGRHARKTQQGGQNQRIKHCCTRRVEDGETMRRNFTACVRKERSSSPSPGSQSISHERPWMSAFLNASLPALNCTKSLSNGLWSGVIPWADTST